MIKKYKKVASYILELNEEEKDVLVALVKHANGDEDVDDQELNSLDPDVVKSVHTKLLTEEKMVYGKKGEEPPASE